MTLSVALLMVATFLAFQGFFSGSEMALISANRARLQARADEGHVGAQQAVALLLHEERLLGTCLIGTNICLISGTVTFRRAAQLSGLSNELLITLLFVPVALLVGEALPKVVYRHHADTLAPLLARPITLVARAFSPALWVVEGWATHLKRLAQSDGGETIRREDIVSLLADGSGTIDPGDRELIRNLLGTADQTVDQCMTPLVHIKTLPEEATTADAIALALQTGFSRLPVYRDRVDNIIGHVEARDLLVAPRDDIPVVQLLRPVSIVPESKRVDALLREMRDERSPLRVVVDEYGGSVGIVTLEDLLEEILGEIEDERDRTLPGIRELGPNEWRVPGHVEVGEFTAATGVDLPQGNYETVAGMLLTVLGRIPSVGERITAGELHFHVDAASDRAILTVRVTVPNREGASS